MMKLRSVLLAGCVVGCTAYLAALTAFEGDESVDAQASIRRSVEFGGGHRIERADPSGSGMRDLLTRADVAFREMKEGGRTRFESRVGLQPWPEDLPESWPTPRDARVVASSIQRHSIQRQGNRLLLVDLPDRPGEALESYRDELEAGGYRILQPRSGRSNHALHAKRGDDEAILTFSGRKHATRLEILFVARGSG
jgi:hypothetical protein